MERIDLINKIYGFIIDHKESHHDRLGINTDFIHYVNISGIEPFINLLNDREPISTQLQLHNHSFKLIYNFSYHPDDFKEYYLGDLRTDYLERINDYLNEKYQKD